jgi:hypothetical protein
VRRVFLSRVTVGAALLGALAGILVAISIARADSSPVNTSQGSGIPPKVVPVLHPTGTASLAVGTASFSSSASPGASAGTASAGAPASPSPGAGTPTAVFAPPTAYEADASTNILAGGARVGSCATCPDGAKVRFLGDGGTLTFPSVAEATAGDYTLTVLYADGDASGGRTAVVGVNSSATSVAFHGNGDWNTLQTLTLRVHLNAGDNRIEFGNPQAVAPDIAQITV